MKGTFEEVIRIKLESLGVENADAFVKAFAEIEQSGQLTGEQLAELAGEFTTLSDVLRDTSAAQADLAPEFRTPG